MKSHISWFGSSARAQWCRSRLYLNLIGSYWRKTPITLKDPCDVSYDTIVTKIKKCKICFGGISTLHDNNIWCALVRVIPFMLQNEQFQYPPQAYNGRGHVTDLTSDDPQEKSEIYKMWVSGGLLFSEGFIFLRKIACHRKRCEVVAFCDRAEVYLWRHR